MFQYRLRSPGGYARLTEVFAVGEEQRLLNRIEYHLPQGAVEVELVEVEPRRILWPAPEDWTT